MTYWTNNIVSYFKNSFPLAIFLLAILISLTGTWDRDFSTRGEAREALVAQNMYASNNWILPSGYGGAVPSKPPAMHWGVVLVSKLVGDVTEFTARVPSLVAMISFLLFFQYFLKERVGKEEAFFSALILMTSFEWFRAGTSCRVDMILSAAFASGLLALYKWDERELIKIPWIAIVLFTIATLCKGPVAIVLPGIIFSLYLLLRGYTFQRVVTSILKVFIPVFLCASIWYISAYVIEQERFLERVYYENIARFIGTAEDEPHKHGILYLLGTVPIGLMPWTLLALPLLLLNRVRSELINKTRNWKRISRFDIYSIIVVSSCVIFFSVPSSKRSVYLLPIYPFLAYLLSKVLIVFNEESEKFAKYLSRSLIFLVSLFLICSILSLFFINLFRIDIGEIFRNLILDITKNWGILDLLLVICFVYYAIIYSPNVRSRQNENKWLERYGIVIALVVSIVSWSLIRPISNSTSSKIMALQFPLDKAEGKPIYSFKNSFYGLSFYLKRPLIMKTEGFNGGSMVVMYEDQYDNFNKILEGKHQAEVIYTSPRGVESFMRPLIVVYLS